MSTTTFTSRLGRIEYWEPAIGKKTHVCHRTGSASCITSAISRRRSICRKALSLWQALCRWLFWSTQDACHQNIPSTTSYSTR